MSRKNGKNIELYTRKAQDGLAVYHVSRNPHLSLHAQKCMLANAYPWFTYLYTTNGTIHFIAEKHGNTQKNTTRRYR